MTTGLSKHDEDSRIETALDTWLSFSDLKQAGIIDNWQTLRAWQKDPRVNFPPGRMLGLNSRRWSKSEIDNWLAARPVEREVA